MNVDTIPIPGPDSAALLVAAFNAWKFSHFLAATDVTFSFLFTDFEYCDLFRRSLSLT